MMPLKLKLMFFFIVLCFCGCSESINALKTFSLDQQEMQKYVEEQKTLFLILKSDIENNKIVPGTPKEKILFAYGTPVICRPDKDKSAKLEVCIYRHPLQGIVSDKIYLYFNKDGNLNSAYYLRNTKHGIQ
ncbi:MAG: hypothetical protein WBI28_04335 [Candidatus Omnitrophota bacterium]